MHLYVADIVNAGGVVSVFITVFGVIVFVGIRASKKRAKTREFGKDTEIEDK